MTLQEKTIQHFTELLAFYEQKAKENYKGAEDKVEMLKFVIDSLEKNV